MSEIKEYHSSFTGPEVDALLTKVKDGSITADIEKELAEKANVNGRYPEMSVGFADDLVGRGESVSAEFSFRASGGKSIKDGAARIKRLKGNSVVWNQKIKSFAEADGTHYETDYIVGDNNSVVVNNWLEYRAFRWNIKSKGSQGHKYLVLFDYKNTNDSQKIAIELGGTYVDYVGTGTVAVFNSAVISDSDYGDYFSLYLADTMDNSIVTLSNLQVIDLTQMFGAGNEPTTIEEFNARKPIVEDEYAYNEGEVIHMTAEGIKSVGDNAWDEEWRNGDYVSSTGAYQSSTKVCNATPIKVIPNSEYYCKVGFQSYGFFYDSNMNYLTNERIDDRKFTTPANAAYMNFYVYLDSYGTTYNNDIMITLVHSGWKQDTDAGYQPYWEDRLIFDQRIKDEFPDGMSKWDMAYNKDGKGYIVKGTGKVDDMANMAWDTGFGGFHSGQIKDSIKGVNGYTISNVLCSRLATGIVGSDNMGLYVIYSGADYPYNRHVRIVGYDTLDALKASLAGVPLYYELAEPTIIEYDEPFNLDYRVADFGTEQAITEQPSAPISADIIYQFNAVDMIREHELEIAELQSIIATMQAQLASLASKE